MEVVGGLFLFHMSRFTEVPVNECCAVCCELIGLLIGSLGPLGDSGRVVGPEGGGKYEPRTTFDDPGAAGD